MTTLKDQPIVQWFKITGLHGYKDVRIDFEAPARVVIAENGAGKTTILSAINAFIRGQFHRLLTINFESIQCKLADSDVPIWLQKSDIRLEPDAATNAQIAQAASYGEVDAAELTAFLLTEFRTVPFEELRGHPIPQAFFDNTPDNWDSIEADFKSLSQTIDSESGRRTAGISDSVTQHFSRYDVLYLPTYRRIEAAPVRKKRTEARRRLGMYQAAHSEIWSANQVHMFYGLTDVEDRLKQLTDEIGRLSNIGYRSISATLLDDLLFESNTTVEGPEHLPSIEDLRLFFSRISKDYESEKRLAALTAAYKDGSINNNENHFLKLFLARLNRVVIETRGREKNLQDFVDVVNIYLNQASDEKEMRYEPEELKVIVTDKWTGLAVALNDLSSGEKQIISLFARLYLTSNEKIVLIDEPELSLSIDWQQRLLPDVMKAPTCRQLLAITHSPFIFANELDPYAGPLAISRRKPAQRLK